MFPATCAAGRATICGDAAWVPAFAGTTNISCVGGFGLRSGGQLADAAGVSVGRIVNISEGFSGAPVPVQFSQGQAASDMKGGAGAVPIQTGSQSVQITVTMTFEIAP